MIPRGAWRLGVLAMLAAAWFGAPRVLAQAGPKPNASGAPATTRAVPDAAPSQASEPRTPDVQQGLAPIPEFTGYVNDRASVLDEPARAKLEAFLDQLHKKTGAEFAILTVRSTAPEAPDQYKVRVFQKWGIGKKGEDNGLLMLLVLDERDLRFETGYGLEGTLPDGLQSRIFRSEMAPHFQAGDFAGGITAGTLACAARIAAEKGVTLEWNGAELRYGSSGGGGLPPFAVAILIAVILLLVVANLGGGMGPGRGGMWLGGGSGWGGGFGGGFGGGGFGGGGFGGGGSFGGFGGGGSGGGGGGGKW
jgi:uncharacterized protein